MSFWKLTVEYDGTDFAGWQSQPRDRTVQDELERALSTVLRSPIRIVGAGRTDAGVHALGQVASFESDLDVAERIHSINGVLAGDVVVRRVERFENPFHARFDAVRRRYRYRLHLGPTAVHRRTALPILTNLDLDEMSRAGELLRGDHDFASFASGLEPGENTRVVLESLEFRQDKTIINVDVTANRFLRKMVRTLVGTLLEVGFGKQPAEWVREVLAHGDRKFAGPVVAPQGLFLVAVDYDPDCPVNRMEVEE